MSGFNMDDYVDVAERIHEFYERFPDGSLRTGTAPHVITVNGKEFIAYHAQAWRTPDDVLPTDGWAWEPVPGPTQFTRDSELMNAETAAWGRAIVALGFSTKKIASRQEVQARGADTRGGGTKGGAGEETVSAQRQPSVSAAATSAPQDQGDPARVVCTFGKKHLNKTLGEILSEDRNYLVWLDEKFEPKTAEQRRILEAARILLGQADSDADIPF